MSTWPVQDLESIDLCPACGGRQHQLRYLDLRDDAFQCAPGTWTMVDCLACGSGYLNPRPTPNSIGRAYSNYYTHDTKSGRTNEGLGLLKRILRALANGYYNEKYGTKFFPASTLGYWIAPLFPERQKQLDNYARHLPRAVAGARLLDVGCGGGDFLLFAKSADWQVTGLDLDPVSVEKCRAMGLEVSLHTPEQLYAEGHRYDRISLSHVIEHVHDPRALLAACFSLLKPEGSLWIQTPNYSSSCHRHFKESWRGLEAPRHLAIFSFEALIRALRDAGFKGAIEHHPSTSCAWIHKVSAEFFRRRTGRKRSAITAMLDTWRIRKFDRLARSEPLKREFLSVTVSRDH